MDNTSIDIVVSGAYGIYNNNLSVRKNSSSGGIFYSLAKYVIERGGVVFGAAFDEDWQVKHIVCESMDELPKLMKSKYVQSSIGNTYIEAGERLFREQLVLFVGTPCQIAGIISFLKTKYNSKFIELRNKLIACDFVCHGVPSRRIWREYVSEISKGREISSIDFRNKDHGWQNYYLKIEFSNKSEYAVSMRNDLYMRGFLSNLFLRPSCYNCSFKGLKRDSDITIGDFWGIEKTYPQKFDDIGASIVIIQSEIGVNIINTIKDDLNIFEIQSDTICQYNSASIRSVTPHRNRKAFFNDKDSHALLSKRIYKYTKPKFSVRVKRYAKKVLLKLGMRKK